MNILDEILEIINILDEISKERLETRHGKIGFASSNWVFNPTPAQIARSGDVREAKDANGHEMHLISQRGAWCKNPEVGSDFPESKHEFWFVPACVCKKCEHYRKGGQRGGLQYPTCQWAASQDAKQDALKDTLNVLHEAKRQVEEMIGRMICMYCEIDLGASDTVMDSHGVCDRCLKPILEEIEAGKK